MDGEELYRKMMAKRREERDSGIMTKGRRDSFEEGYHFGGLIKMFGGIAKIPSQFLESFQPPKSKKAKRKWDLGVLFGKRD